MFYCAQMMTEAVYEMTPAAVPGSGTGELPQEARQEPGSLEKYVSETIPKLESAAKSISFLNQGGSLVHFSSTYR